MELTITPIDLQKINKATFHAFIEMGKYAYSKAEAYRVFGKVQIDLLVTNKLLHDTSDLPCKCRFLLSDIITAFYVWDNMGKAPKTRRKKL